MIAFIAIAFVLVILNKPEPPGEEQPGFIPADNWFEQQRAFPFEEIPQEEYLRAQEYVKTSMRTSSLVGGNPWVLAGPTNIEGRITSLVIDPTDHNTVYAGSANGGIWKTTDFCQSWVSVFDDQNTSSIGALAIDPVFPEVIYCGTGEANSLRSYYPGTGMFKSTNGGASWTHIGLANSFSIGAIAINPLNTQELYVAVLGSLRRKTQERGVFRSTDGGASWTNVLFVADSVGAVDVVIDPSSPNRVFAAMWERTRREDYIKYGGAGSALYLSTNSGNSWSAITNGFPSNDATLGRISLDIARSNPQILYALTANTSGTSRGLFKSSDGGASWALIHNTVAPSSNYAWFNRICKVNPANPDHVFAGGLQMFVSANGGANFSAIGPMHVDQHAVAISQTNPGFIVVGNDGGVDYSVNGGLSYTANDKLPITQFYAGEINTANPFDILGGTQDNGCVRTTTGLLNDWNDFYGGDGFYCLIDYANPMNVYASSQYGGLGRSTNGGASFLSGVTGLDRAFTNWMTPFAMDKNNPQILYCGTYKIHRSTNGMQSWTPISPDLAAGHVELLGTITTVDVAASNPNVIYCGTDDANVWVTTNGGGNWQLIRAGLPRRWVTRVTIHPDSANVCYVALSGYKVDSAGSHIYRTTNFGASWLSIRGNLPDAPINDIVIDPLVNSTLYIATDVGVMVSTDLGANWDILGSAFSSSVPCHDLTLHNASRTLVVWTHGRSAFRMSLIPTAVGENVQQPGSFLLHQNYPNPFNPSTTISFQIDRPAFVRLTIYDATGREVSRLVAENLQPGTHTREFISSQNASGVYFYRLTIDKRSESRKMLLLR